MKRSRQTELKVMCSYDMQSDMTYVLLHVLDIEALDISTLALRQVRRIDVFSRISWGSCPRPQKAAAKLQTLSII
jgi:hypothetical protein